VTGASRTWRPLAGKTLNARPKLSGTLSHSRCSEKKKPQPAVPRTHPVRPFQSSPEPTPHRAGLEHLVTGFPPRHRFPPNGTRSPGVPPSPGLPNRECPRWISATGRRCRSPSSTCPWPDGERLSVGATGLRYAYAAVPSHKRRVQSVETAPRWPALA